MGAVRSTVMENELFDSIDQAISNTTPVNGAIVDTKDYNQGVGFYYALTAYTAGDLTITIEHGDESDLSDAVEIDAEMYVTQRSARRTLSAATAGSHIGVGCFSTKRFVRPVVTGANSPDATATVKALLAPRYTPAT